MQGFELADRYGLQEACDDRQDACVAYETEAGHGTSDEAIVCEIVMQESLTLCMSLAAVMANKALKKMDVGDADISDDDLIPGEPSEMHPRAPSDMPPDYMHEDIVLASDDAY